MEKRVLKNTFFHANLKLAGRDGVCGVLLGSGMATNLSAGVLGSVLCELWKGHRKDEVAVAYLCIFGCYGWRAVNGWSNACDVWRMRAFHCKRAADTGILHWRMRACHGKRAMSHVSHVAQRQVWEKCALALRVALVSKEWSEQMKSCQISGESFEHAIGVCFFLGSLSAASSLTHRALAENVIVFINSSQSVCDIPQGGVWHSKM